MPARCRTLLVDAPERQGLKRPRQPEGQGPVVPAYGCALDPFRGFPGPELIGPKGYHWFRTGCDTGRDEPPRGRHTPPFKGA